MEVILNGKESELRLSVRLSPKQPKYITSNLDLTIFGDASVEVRGITVSGYDLLNAVKAATGAQIE